MYTVRSEIAFKPKKLMWRLEQNVGSVLFRGEGIDAEIRETTRSRSIASTARNQESNTALNMLVHRH
ncbi:hypothetical protein V3C99_017155 [Haemonchus contortus]|uniref:Uncharacterized protein n=1 Tax=Haemonchus contortus TaxID=6289 RepID=A0A7I4Z7N3_HAECO